MENPKTLQVIESPNNSKPSQSRNDRLGWLIEQLAMAALAKGQMYSPERLRINAEDLVDIPQDRLQEAFRRARQELDFVPGVAEIRRLALADQGVLIDAEMRKAWEIVDRFAGKWCRWNCERDCAYVEAGAPKLSQRIMDTVRRTGGWTVYLQLAPEDFPFQQKRFFEEYKAWDAVNATVDTGKLLQMPDLKKLATERQM